MTPSPTKNRSTSGTSKLITISELPELHQDGTKSLDINNGLSRKRLFKNHFESQTGKNEMNLISSSSFDSILHTASLKSLSN